ncbi:protein serine/threonine phosphatase 2C [Hyphopichia burtonii NRRL Y-1933]|uniref:protein-serine/threonine phosphatase n=1 Tax=Hyphopichia burtonii NRRL Y-1933 TaxID=984485 RepID=A0A1E4RRK4_9ASCO|nr:protein serine/threonine phosphatase 2C [Hyphopichia burtonii NRRL Y-1933]ODV69919.1 protein serine/threonine phosphatase 2C [Hyphopichia burtonii NRRL Y-1933]
MGQLLSHPIEDKTLDYKAFQSLAYCVGSMQGYRMTMEDAHNVKINEDESLAVFGVFDGHGGKACADYISDVLPSKIFKNLNSYLKKSHYNNTSALNKDYVNQVSNGISDLSTYMKIIKDSFFEVDHDLPVQNSLNCGSTAIITTIVANKYIIVANTGDSRSIMSLNGGAAKTLSFDHKPSTMSERVRIENSGGYVVSGRVNEILALSRAFGDFKFKFPFIELSNSINNSNNKYLEANKKYFKDDLVHLPPELFQVSVEPDLLVYDLSYLKQPEFIVLACDGIWDCYTNNQLISLIRKKISEDWKLNHITEFILNDCIGMASSITGIGFDNMTLIIVAIHTNGNIDEWYQIIKNRVKNEEKLNLNNEISTTNDNRI